MAKKTIAPESAGETPEKLPTVTKRYRDPVSQALITVEHDPNTGKYVETCQLGGKTTKTLHDGLSHAWGRFIEIKDK